MPQIVESDTRDSTSLDDAIEELGDRFRVEEAAVRVAEHPVVGVLWEVLVSKPSTPAGEDVTCVVIEFDGASAGSCLDAELDGLAADILERARNRQSRSRDVEVGPLQSDDLAAAHAGVGGEVQCRVKPL